MSVRNSTLLLGGLGMQLLFGLTSAPAPALLASMTLIAAFLWLNRARRGFALTLTGLGLNIIVIGANGAMPVSGYALERISISGVAPNDLRHTIADGRTTLSFLGDVIQLGERVVSIGDILMAAGLMWFLVVTAWCLVRSRFPGETIPCQASNPARESTHVIST